MTLASRTMLTLLVCLSGGVQAQTFAPSSSAEVEANRTAQRLAATQRGGASSAYVGSHSSSSPASSGKFLVTRQSENPNSLLAQASPAPSVMAPTGYASSSTQYASAQYASAPAPAYDTSYVSSGSAIPAMPDARPGECFALVKIPERFRSYQQEYELRAASERLETIPPRYEMVTEQYVAQEAYERLEVVPARFRTVTEQVEVAAPSSRYVSTEPVYETVTERVLEQPARTVWKRGNGPIQRIDNATGEIMCLVEEPAIYKTITRRVLKTPAEAREVAVPGQYSTISRQVIDEPAGVRRIVVPERVATRTVRKLVEPGGVRRIPIPAQMATRTVRELVEPARLEWRSVLCETNMTPANIRAVQGALMREGYNPGPATGQLNSQTISALNAYQRAHNLPEDRYLNMDSVRALGVM